MALLSIHILEISVSVYGLKYRYTANSNMHKYFTASQLVTYIATCLSSIWMYHLLVILFKLWFNTLHSVHDYLDCFNKYDFVAVI